MVSGFQKKKTIKEPEEEYKSDNESEDISYDILDPQLEVVVEDGHCVKLGEISVITVIFCPKHQPTPDHEIQIPSAFIITGLDIWEKLIMCLECNTVTVDQYGKWVSNKVIEESEEEYESDSEREDSSDEESSSETDQDTVVNTSSVRSTLANNTKQEKTQWNTR